MSNTALAVIVVLSSGTVVGALLKFVRTFGQYTEQLRSYRDDVLAAKEAVIFALDTNKIVHEKIMQIQTDIQHERRQEKRA